MPEQPKLSLKQDIDTRLKIIENDILKDSEQAKSLFTQNELLKSDFYKRDLSNESINNISRDVLTTQLPKPDYKPKIERLSLLFKKLSNNYFKRHFFNNLITIAKEEKIIQKKLKLLYSYKKERIFRTFKEVCDHIKLNKLYLTEIIKNKLKIFSINDHILMDNNKIDKRHFFNYDDLKSILIEKLLSNENNFNYESFYYFKLNIYTQKHLFHSTYIIQNLFRQEDPNIEIHENNYSLIISDKFKKINIREDIEITLSIFINIIFIDQIPDISIYIQDNSFSINKFSHGLVYLNYEQIDLLNKLMIILDYSQADKKDFVFIDYIKPVEDLLNIKTKNENIMLLKQKYLKSEPAQSQEYYSFYSTKDFNNYYRDIVEYYNNLNLYTIFDKKLFFLKFSAFELYGIYDLYSYKLDLKDRINKLIVSNKNYFVIKIPEITHRHWIKFFVNVKLIYFN